jgi:uncharacterized protein (TIGR02646 family)
VIRIQRPKREPARLAKQGAAARRSDCRAFARGVTTFEFAAKIYGHPSVKTALINAQHNKCAFCESKVTHVASGHVEHFRPKGGVRQRKGDPLQKPGYFWLAYEWTNLLFSCEICNSRFKGNLFPLSNPAARARKPEDDLALEQPLFVNPAVEDPAAHIGFREEYPFAVNGSARGEATWKALGLDREKLAEIRRDHLQTVKTLKILRDQGATASQRSEAAKLLTKMSGKTGQWSAMVRAAVGTGADAGARPTRSLGAKRPRS